MDTFKQMPNLMGASHRPLHGAADRNRRILAQLEHGPKASSRANHPVRASRLDGWTMGLVVLLLTIGGVAWLMHEETITPVTFKRHADGGRSAADLFAQTTATAPATTAAPVRSATATPTAETMALAGTAPVAANAATRNDDGDRPAAIIDAHHGTPAMGLAATPAAPRTLTGGAPKTPDSTNLRATSAKVAKTADNAGAHQNTATVSGTLAPKTPRRHPGSSPSPGTTSDSDVTLLTALVAHAGKPASVASERSRDVVERANGVPTADLLGRCKQLGLMEGMLCRSRICSGSWESDPACSAPAQ